jgi:roadblock/LC7 domain-containing protein
MPNLDELMNLPGAMAAFSFTDDGRLQEHKSSHEQLNEDVLDLLCHVCVANISIATMQARGWEKLTGMQGFYPISGFTFVGFDWSAVTHNGYGVVLANQDADYEAAYQALT